MWGWGKIRRARVRQARALPGPWFPVRVDDFLLVAISSESLIAESLLSESLISGSRISSESLVSESLSSESPIMMDIWVGARQARVRQVKALLAREKAAAKHA